MALFVLLLDFGTVPAVWHFLFFYCILEVLQQCGFICSDIVALFVFVLDFGDVPTVWQCCFSIGLWNCSDIVALFVFALNFGTVLTAWHYLFFYWALELFPQCGIIGLSNVLWI